MKKYIDYFFWKRSWFRIGFVAFPIWIAIPAMLGYLGEQNSVTRNGWCLLVMALWGLALADNDDVDSPTNPFKKKTPKRFKNWVEASKHLNQEIVVECVEMPNIIGKMDSIYVASGDKSMTAFITVVGHSEQFAYWRCRPKD